VVKRLLSKYKPRIFTSLATESGWLFRKTNGSGCNFCWLHKWAMHVMPM